MVAVKISLSEFEQNWRNSEEPIALADASGVVFLGNRSAWRYHSMRQLNETEMKSLDGTLQYAAQPILPITRLPRIQQAGYGEHLAKPVGRLGWQLMLFPLPAFVRQGAGLTNGHCPEFDCCRAVRAQADMV